MFNETSYYPSGSPRGLYASGLGDAYSDCIATVRGYPDEYYFKGAGITYTATGVTGAALTDGTISGSIRAALGNFYDVTVNVQTGAIGWSGKQVNITIFGRQNVDRGSINHIKSELDAAAAKGMTVNASQVSTQKPNPESICAPYKGQPGPGREPGGTRPPIDTTPTFASGFDQFIADIKGSLGIASTGVLIGGAVVLILLLKKI